MSMNFDDMPTTPVWGHDVPDVIIESARLTAVGLFGAALGIRAMTDTLYAKFCRPTGVSVLTQTAVDTSACGPVTNTAGTWVLALAGLGIVFFAIGIALPWIGGEN